MVEYARLIGLLTPHTAPDQPRSVRRACESAIDVLGALEARGHDPADVAPFLARIRDAVAAGPEPANLMRARNELMRHLDRAHRLYPPHHFRNTWMALGMVIFGLPIGAALGAAQDNMGLLGIGLPMGLAIGLSIGAGMDQTVAAEGRQLAMKGD